MNTNEHENTKTVLRLLVADLEAKVEHPEAFTPREQEHNKRMLALRQLELRDLEAARWGD